MSEEGKQKVMESIESLPMQVEQVWDDFRTVTVPQSCFLAKNIVICGMGGSALGGRIAKSLVGEEIRIPMEVYTEYAIPAYVDENSLVIVSSYSGNTEETIGAFTEARERHARIFVISTGGRIGEYAKAQAIPSYIFKPKYNPSGQPRNALGYSISSVLAILARCKFVDITISDVDDLRGEMNKFDETIGKEMAAKLKDRFAVLVASEHLVGVVHAFANMLNETSKTFSVLYDIPELNHHLIEGLGYPKDLGKKSLFIVFESGLYSARVKQIYPVSESIFEKNGMVVEKYKVGSKSKLGQIFEVLMLGSWTSYYLAEEYGVNPVEIPAIANFKEQMAKR